jgi:hypothetical protein
MLPSTTLEIKNRDMESKTFNMKLMLMRGLPCEWRLGGGSSRGHLITHWDAANSFNKSLKWVMTHDLRRSFTI